MNWVIAKDNATLIAACIAAIIALVNLVVTPTFARLNEHTKWKREQRLLAYVEFMAAVDKIQGWYLKWPSEIGRVTELIDESKESTASLSQQGAEISKGIKTIGRKMRRVSSQISRANETTEVEGLKAVLSDLDQSLDINSERLARHDYALDQNDTELLEAKAQHLTVSREAIDSLIEEVQEFHKVWRAVQLLGSDVTVASAAYVQQEILKFSVMTKLSDEDNAALSQAVARFVKAARKELTA